MRRLLAVITLVAALVAGTSIAYGCGGSILDPCMTDRTSN
jgi:hypothetical protein